MELYRQVFLLFLPKTMEVDIPLEDDEGNRTTIHLVINFNLRGSQKQRVQEAVSPVSPVRSTCSSPVVPRSPPQTVLCDDSCIDKEIEGIAKRKKNLLSSVRNAFSKKVRSRDSTPTKPREGSALSSPQRPRTETTESVVRVSNTQEVAALVDEAELPAQTTSSRPGSPYKSPERVRRFHVPVPDQEEPSVLTMKPEITPADTSAEDTSYLSVKAYMDDYMTSHGKTPLNYRMIDRCQKFIFRQYNMLYGKDYDRQITDSAGDINYEYVASRALPLFEMLKDSANWAR